VRDGVRNGPVPSIRARSGAHRQVHSKRLHPLLCALASAERVAYTEQRETPTRNPSGKFRSGVSGRRG